MKMEVPTEPSEHAGIHVLKPAGNLVADTPIRCGTTSSAGSLIFRRRLPHPPGCPRTPLPMHSYVVYEEDLPQILYCADD